MGRRVCHISAAELLHEDCRRELRNRELLRSAANGQDCVWQQMTLANFSDLLQRKSLYLKAYGEYADYDEMKLSDFVDVHTRGIPDRAMRERIAERLRREYDAFEKKLFISCWYNSRELSDVVFKVYAKGGSGVAIGTDVASLERQLEQTLAVDARIHHIVCANIQYVRQMRLRTGELFEPAQVYAPVFTKGLQFTMDHEFRVCVELEQPQELVLNSAQTVERRRGEAACAAERIRQAGGDCKIASENFLEIIDRQEEALREEEEERLRRCAPRHIYLPVDLPELLRYIAVKDDSWLHSLGTEGIQDLFERRFRLKLEPKPADSASGFLIFGIKEWGDRL